MWLSITFALLRCVLAVEVLSELGDISVFPNQTLRIEVSGVFQGAFLEYEARSTNAQVTLIPSIQLENAWKAPLDGKPRKIGPVFQYQAELYLTMYTSDTLELWLVSGNFTRKIWERNTEPIRGIDVLSKTNQPGLVYWTNAFAFYYLNCAMAISFNNATSQQIPNIAAFPEMKVAVCSNNNEILSTNKTNAFLRYPFDDLSVTVSSPFIELRNSSIVDIICPEEAIVLTSDGVYSDHMKIVSDDHVITSLWKVDSHWAAEGSHAVFFAFRPSEVEMHYWMSNMTLLSFTFEREKLEIAVVVRANNTDFLMHWNENEWEMARIPQISAQCEVRVANRFNPSTLLLFQVCQSEFSMHSIVFTSRRLLVTATELSATLDLCAVDFFDREQICTHSLIHTVTSPPSIMSQDGFKLTSDFHEKRLGVFVSSKPSENLFLISRWLSGSNMDYSIELPQFPSSLTVSHSISNWETRATENYEVPFPVESAIKCLSFTNPRFEIVIIKGRRIEYHQLNYAIGNAQFSIPDPLFTVSMCAVSQGIIFLLGSRPLDNGSIIALMFNPVIFRELPIKGVKGIATADNAILCFTAFSVFELTTWSFALRLRWVSEHEILDIWTEEHSVWILSEGRAERVNLIFNISVVIPIRPSWKLVGFQDVVIGYQSNTLSIYSTLSKRLLNTLTLDCEISNVQHYQNFLFVKCAQYIQIVSLLLREHNAMIARLPTTPISLIQSNTHLKCTETQCHFIVYHELLEPTLRLYIAVPNISFFKEADAFSCQLAIRSGNERKIMRLVIDVDSAYSLIRVNPRWHNFTYDLLWSDSLYIPLSELFFGEIANIGLQTSNSDFHYELLLRYSITNQLQIRSPSRLELWDICIDSNVIVHIEHEHIVFEHYKCAMYICRSGADKVHLTEFGFHSMLAVEVIYCQDSLLLLYLKGFNVAIETIEKLLNYDLLSHAQITLFEKKQINHKQFFHLLRESSTTLHLFQVSTVFVHYILHCDSPFTLISRTVILTEDLLFPLSVESTLVSGDWKVFILDATRGLLEYALRDKLELLRTIHIQQWLLQTSIAKVTGDYIVLCNITSLIWYSLSSFTPIRSLHIGSVRNTLITEKIARSRSGLIAIHRHELRSLIIIDTAAPAHSETVAIFNFTSFKFVSAFDAVGVNSDGAFSYIHFGESLLVLSSAPRDDLARFEFQLVAENSEGSVSSPVFTVLRIKERVKSHTKWAWGLSFLVALSGLLGVWAWKRGHLRVGTVEEVEIVSMNSSRRNDS